MVQGGLGQLRIERSVLRVSQQHVDGSLDDADLFAGQRRHQQVDGLAHQRPAPSFVAEQLGRGVVELDREQWPGRVDPGELGHRDARRLGVDGEQ